MTRFAFALVSIVACVGVARADAIAGPPACPPGARGASAHEGEWCEPWPCTSDAECEGGRCVRWRVCTRVASVTPGGLRARPVPPEPRTLVVGTCDPARACDGTEEPPPPVVGTFEGAAPPACDDARYCVPAALPPLPAGPTPPAASESPAPSASAPTPPATAPRNCGCRVAGSPARAPWAFLAVALVLWRRR